MKKRKDYIGWDEFFISIAKLNSFRSKDPTTQVGCVVVNELKQVLAMGYNGLPRTLSDNNYPWERKSDEWLENKYPYVVHAELNAILSASCSLRGSVIYVSLFPCNECAKAIIQSGIIEILYTNDKYKGTKENVASKRMLKDAKIKLTKISDINVEIKKL